MTQHHSLGSTGGAGSINDRNRILISNLICNGFYLGNSFRGGQGQHFFPVFAIGHMFKRKDFF